MSHESAASEAPSLVVAASSTDAKLRVQLEGIVRSAREHFGARLHSVVLAGSLARGEGMVLRAEDRERLISDIDLYIVCDALEPSDGAWTARVHSEVEAADWMVAPLDLAVVEVGHFGSVSQTLVHAQLTHGSRVLYAREPAPQRSSPGRVDVDREDAFRLVLNRCAEAVLIRGEHTVFSRVHRLKQWMDAPLAWLAARGDYTPSRHAQCDRLDEIADTLDPAAGEWLRAGTTHTRAWLSAVRTHALDDHLLDEFANVGENAPGHTVRDWVWPFVRCAWRDADGLSTASLEAAVLDGPPRAEDRQLAVGWLRRHAPRTRLRLARRWVPLAPRALTPWWRHGFGGVGTERLWVACALRYGGVEGGFDPLAGLFAEAVKETDLDDRALAQIWADWFLGGGRR